MSVYARPGTIIINGQSIHLDPEGASAFSFVMQQRLVMTDRPFVAVTSDGADGMRKIFVNRSTQVEVLTSLEEDDEQLYDVYYEKWMDSVARNDSILLIRHYAD